LSHKDIEMRRCAALALLEIRGRHAAAQAELIRILEKQPWQLQRQEIEEILVDLGQAAKAATPTLLRLLRQDNDSLYHASVRVLRAVNPEAAAVAGVAEAGQKVRARTHR
jgi:hypothetical protein